jgi:formamidopyrimidine-DNA glycosylase
MFELPELITLARQINATLSGLEVSSGSLGYSPHKFVWYNRTPEAFAGLVSGKTVGQASAKGKWLFVPLEPGYLLLLGECGGKLLYHAPGAGLPPKYHLSLSFADGSRVTALTQMWGAMELWEAGQEQERQYIKDMRPTPVDAAFTLDYFSGLIDSLLAGEKRSVKGLLTQEQHIPGLGNAISQDIMFRSGLRPKHPIAELSAGQRRALYDAITATVREAVAQGGRCDEFDLYNHPGGYTRVMDSRAAGRPCPQCGTTIEKLQYLGGACYFCPNCQA